MRSSLRSSLFAKERNKKLRKWFLLIFGIVCIAVSAIFVKKANVHGLVSATYRIIVALITVLPIMLIKKQKAATVKNKLLCAFAGMFFGFELACWNVAIMSSSATMPTLLVNLSSIWVGIGAFLFLKEKTTTFHWAGNAIALFGVVVIIGFRQILHLRIEQGILLAIAASVFLAMYTLLIRKVRMEMSTITVLFYALIGSAIPLLIMCFVMKLPLIGYSNNSLIYLISLGLITQIGGYFSINYVLGHIPSIKVSLITLLQPVLTAIFACVFLKEIIQTNKIIGGCIVLLGIAVSFIKIGGKKIGEAA
jgi:Permeases of the drug/metabolite transporter (DMT) superfamily